MIEFGELATQFSLGNAAILTNVCLLPLYPGLIAFLAGNVQSNMAAANAGEGSETVTATERPVWVTGLLGVFVLAGVLTAMIMLGLFVHIIEREFADFFGVLLPALYITVIAFGLLMLTGHNPFAKISTIQAPILKNPFATAFIYGMLLGPMTLPCTGALITTAFTVGTSSISSIEVEIIYVVAFGLGFGWPLLVLPLFAAPLQKRFTSWLTKNHVLLTRASGILLIAIGVLGFVTEVLTNSNSAAI